MINNLLKKIIGNDIKDKIVLKNIILSFGIRGMALALALIKMPMYIKYFNNEEILGIWFTILSILTWIFNFDLGIGNGLRNKLVKPIEEKNELEARKYISSGYLSITIVTILIGTILAIIIPQINWNSFFNTTTNLISNNTFSNVIFTVLIGLLIQFILKLINSIFYALQKSFFPGLLNFISELLLLIVIMSLNKDITITNKLEIIAISYSLCMIVPLFIANIIMFTTKLKNSKPSIKYFSTRYAKLILTLGGMFFWIQIMYMIIVNTNEYLITWFIGPKYVVEYQIYYKIFSMVGTLFTLMLTPMWSMVTKALNNNDLEWIQKLYNKLIKVTILAIFAEFLIIPFLQFLINMWLGKNAIEVNYWFSIIFAISGSLMIWNGVISTIVNGLGKLKIQFVFMTSGVIINIPLAYILCNLLNSWIGVVLANIVSFMPYCIIQPIFIKKYINN